MSTASGGQQQVSRPLQILLGVVVGLGLLYALWTFVLSPLLAGDDGDDVGATPGTVEPATPDGDVVDPVPDPAVTDPEVPETLSGNPVPETFELFVARDPFQQLVVEVGQEGAGAVVDADEPEDGATPAPTPSATTGTTGSGTTTPNPAPTSNADDIDTDDGAAPDDDGLETQDQQPAGPREIYEPQTGQAGDTPVRLEAVHDTTSLTVAIDDAPYDVAEGEVFAERFQLLDVDGACATFLYGDSRFVLCEGETIMK